MAAINGAHDVVTDNYKVHYYQNDDGKYVVGTSVKGGKIGAGMKVFDTAAEANAYLEELGVEDSLFAEDSGANGTGQADKTEKDNSLFASSDYSKSIGKLAGLGTKFTLANLLTGGKYSEQIEKATEQISRFSSMNVLANITGKAVNGELTQSSNYSKNMGQAAEFITGGSLLDIATGGKYSEAAGQGVEQLSRYSTNNIISNLIA